MKSIILDKLKRYQSRKSKKERKKHLPYSNLIQPDAQVDKYGLFNDALGENVNKRSKTKHKS